MELQIYLARIDPSLASDLEVNFIGLVDKPAIDRNFLAFTSNKTKARFIIDDEKRVISGPAMIADMPLYRKDDKLGEYYVVFDRASIRTIVEKFAAKGFMQKFNLFHDDQQQVTDVTIFNSFISDKSLGVQPLAGFEDVADGSWFISAKVNNDAVWARVKTGVIKGFSVEGLFAYMPAVKAQMSTSNDLTGDDVCFLASMIPQFQTALQTAILIGKDSKLYAFAQDIIKSQAADIEQMKQWLGNGRVAAQMSSEALLQKIGSILNETLTPD